MAETRVDAAIAALVQMWTAADIDTVDGAFVSGEVGDRLFVGYDGDPEGEFQAADLGSEWAGLGAKARDEEFDIVCAVVTRPGFTSASEARNAAITLFQTAAAALRANPSLGLPPPTVAAARAEALYTPPTSSGVQGRLVFNVHVNTRV